MKKLVLALFLSCGLFSCNVSRNDSQWYIISGYRSIDRVFCRHEVNLPYKSDYITFKDSCGKFTTGDSVVFSKSPNHFQENP